MFVHDLFLDPTIRLICNAEGDEGPDSGAGAGSPPGGTGEAPPPDPNAGAPVGATGASGEPLPDPEAARAAGWTKEALEKQVARQHRKNKELEAQVAEMAEIKAENLRLQELARAATSRTAGSQPDAGDRPSPPPSPPAPPVALDRNAIREEERFNLQVEGLTEQLKAGYAADWPVAADNYGKIIGTNGQLMRDLTSQVLATDDPAYVMVTLGKDPSKLQDVIEMPRDKRLAALMKMAMEKVAKPVGEVKKPSGAPPPPSGDHQRGGAPPSGSGLNLYDEKLEFKNYAGNLDAEKDADDAWYAERQRLKRESKGRPWSIGR